VADATFILVHSPLVGTLTWRPVADALEARGNRVAVPSLLGVQESPQPHWRWCADRLADALGREEGSLVLAGHSGAGPLLPIVGHDVGDVRTYLFVDATIPARTGSTPVVPAEFLASLETRAENGYLPKWSQWWGEDAMRTLVPDDAMRVRLEEEMPLLPLTYFQESVPVPPDWPDAACGYLQFSPAYDAEVREAEARGWRTLRLPGEHLHMVVDPEGVAAALIDLAGLPD
jgi:hypothetical protein